jgi:hypothetical protein
MNSLRNQPKIYHITHVNNLQSIASEGRLICDASILARGGPTASIGMSKIKHRRLSLPVTCYSEDKVAHYVPFYFCPRSVMLFIIHKGNDPELSYRGGQGPIVHLEADMETAIQWAEEHGRRWAFSLSNAGAYYTTFCNSRDELHRINWIAVSSNDFRDPSVKEGKQAEFLLHSEFPWTLVNRIGISSPQLAARAYAALAGTAHQPTIEVRRDWYF